MKISELGEWGLIERFSKNFLKGLPPGTTGIGDDTAVIPWDQDNSLLVTTDMLIEGSHFLEDGISPLDLGHKSLAVNLSDISAMGGQPTSAFLSLGLPSDLPVVWVDDFFEGLHRLAEKYHVNLLGGDTTRSEKSIVINITVLGRVENRCLKLRSQAKIGDVICVTGALGDSAAGLKCLMESKPFDLAVKTLVKRHHRPDPHVFEGQWLAKLPGVHAMMDVSDGVDSDLRHILKRSQCGAKIDTSQLPISDVLKKVSETHGWNPQDIAAIGGEDYCLLLTVAANDFAKINADFTRQFGRPLSAIGKITDQVENLTYTSEGRAYTIPLRGWSHFDTEK